MICVDSKSSDLDKIARIHVKTFSDSLSSRLGFKYCRKMISWYLEDERGELFHLVESGEILGYCGGLSITVPGKHGSATSVTQFSFKELITSFIFRPWLVFHPEIRKRLPFIWKNLKLRLGLSRMNKQKKITDTVKPFVPSMGLVVIGVLPECQGKGYGSVILKEFERRAREKGFKQINLSVKKENEQAIAAYMKNGWLISSTGEEELSMHKILT
jgi:ribosomal protein S18 acetylase RimI-like enzyme